MQCKVSDELKYIWEGLCQTVIVENANQRQRIHETLDNFNKKVSCLTLWRALVHDTLFQMFHRQGMNPNCSRPDATCAQKVPLSTFLGAKARSFKPSVDLQKIGSRRYWMSFSPQSEHETTSSIIILLHLHKVGWGEGAKLWQAVALAVASASHVANKCQRTAVETCV